MSRLAGWLPRGQMLPDQVWDRRHRGIQTLLWLHVPVLFLYALIQGQGVGHSLMEASAVAAFAAVGIAMRSDRRLSTVVASLGLLTSSAVLVHLSDGLIEMHFHYFVIVGVVALYQDWRPFLVAIGYVVVQHGVAGAIDPAAVFDHAGAAENPWRYAALHGFFILGMSGTGLVSWRLNEALLRATADREERLAEAQALAGLGSWELDLTTGEQLWSDQLYRLFGVDPGEENPSTASILATVHPEDQDALVSLRAALYSGTSCTMDFRILLPDGGVRWVHARGAVKERRGGEAAIMSGTVQDITERKRAEAEIHGALSLLNATLDSTADGILVVDRDGRMRSFNRKFVEMWNLSDAVLASGDDNQAMRSVLSQLSDPDGFVAKVQELYAQPEAHSRDLVEFRDGRTVERCSQPQRVDGVPVGRVWSFRDITERVRLERELAHQAFHDSLTGLANQVLFADRVAHALTRASRRHTALAVLFVDLDDFKTVNDSLGHPAGDALLIAVAQRLRDCLRATDTAARLGGDEFALLIEDLHSKDEVTRLADRVIAALNKPFVIAGRELVVGASVGIAFDETEITTEQLLRNADIAMYTAKGSGKRRFAIFETEMLTAAVDRLEIETDLRQALDRQELTLQYQPIVALDSGRVAGVEALVRWHHPRRGLLAPAVFIPVAEETGLICELGRQVLLEACVQARRWQQLRPQDPPLTLSVNLSPRQLQADDLITNVVEALAVSGLDPATLILEITEGAMIHDTDVIVPRLEALKALGVRVALDDFGTGYSSFSYLQRLPIDVLKIDRSFIGTLQTDEKRASLTQAIVSLAQTMDLVAVAEGVETATQAEELGRIGCDLAQGFYLARPMDADAVDDVLSSGLPVADREPAIASPA
ncbi:MAG TPA: EAL domain-containing protein [Acidimicrobiia bacterium]|nr:EAL domain-containing protein [Acidimicrobiia bacterium]